MLSIVLSDIESEQFEAEGHVPLIRLEHVRVGTEVLVLWDGWEATAEVIRSTPYNKWWITHVRANSE